MEGEDIMVSPLIQHHSVVQKQKEKVPRTQRKQFVCFSSVHTVQDECRKGMTILI